MNDNSNIINYLIKDINDKDKQVTTLNNNLKYYRVYSLATTILLIIVSIILFVNIDTMKLVVIFIFLIMAILIYFAFKN